jgi:2-polyprenyl-3-methyl-5-hydroxy-6-metoxy-1,4-benzoquinol methylase
MPEPKAEHHLAVRRDYDRRTEQWVTIYDGTSFHDVTIRRRLEHTLDLVDGLGASGSALDVGCGGGQLALELARRGWTTHATDVSDGMVDATTALAEASGLSVDARQADATDLPFADGELQLITALGLIEYLHDPTAGLRELARALAPGGHLIVTAPNPVRLAYLLDPIGVVRARIAPPQGGYRRHYLSLGRFRRAVEATGLEVLDIHGHGLGPLTFAGHPLMSEERAVRLGDSLERRLPRRLTNRLGANLIAFARKR